VALLVAARLALLLVAVAALDIGRALTAEELVLLAVVAADAMLPVSAVLRLAAAAVLVLLPGVAELAVWEAPQAASMSEVAPPAAAVRKRRRPSSDSKVTPSASS
jgi:hypothetical protein